MTSSSSSTPTPNEFVVPEGKAYAATDIEVSEAAEFLMTQLEPINPEDLDLEDWKCIIC